MLEMGSSLVDSTGEIGLIEDLLRNFFEGRIRSVFFGKAEPASLAVVSRIAPSR
jgi:hypothetical protein